MNYKIAIILIFIFFISIIGIVKMRADRNHGIQVGQENEKIAQQKIITNQVNILIPWVLQHSSRISTDTARLIVTESFKTRQPLLVLSLIAVESEFVPTAVSHQGAVGLTQVMFNVHGKKLIQAGIIKDKRDLFNPDVSIKAGNTILEEYLVQSHGDVPRALERYLGGRDGVYVKRILSHVVNLYILTQGRS